MSLLDMAINFILGHFHVAYQAIAQELVAAGTHASDPANPHAVMSDVDRDRMRANIDYVSRVCERLVLASACNRLERMNIYFISGQPITYSQIFDQLIILKEAIEDDIKTEFFYHYPKHKARLIHFCNVEWAETLKAFPSLEKEIEEGIDCYALDHNTACVFHMMRVAELGMRALARERRVSFPRHPLEWADWQNILDETEKRARAATQGMSRGPSRDAMQAFYQGAIGQLHGFKDTYRNVVMHVRRSYDELDALKAITQVRDFMNGLSAKIGEKTTRPIPARRWP